MQPKSQSLLSRCSLLKPLKKLGLGPRSSTHRCLIMRRSIQSWSVEGMLAGWPGQTPLNPRPCDAAKVPLT